jgi:hypothetical protein
VNPNENIEPKPSLNTMIDYFVSAPTATEAVLRRIKGNHRRSFVARAIKDDGLDAVPPAWTAHSLSELLANMLQAQHPQARGGEDLPDLNDDEVEIARMSLTNSVHGEVTSLRARPGSEPQEILYRMVDEYESEIELPITSSPAPLTLEQVLTMFYDADPSPTETECEVEFQSFFYPGINAAAQEIDLE